MISYLQAARELDARWTGSLQFLPPTPTLRNECDCIAARQIAATEIDIFNRYAMEIAATNGLKLGLLLDLYDMLLSTGQMFADELYEVRLSAVSNPHRASKHGPSRLNMAIEAQIASSPSSSGVSGSFAAARRPQLNR